VVLSAAEREQLSFGEQLMACPPSFSAQALAMRSRIIHAREGDSSYSDLNELSWPGWRLRTCRGGSLADGAVEIIFSLGLNRLVVARVCLRVLGGGPGLCTVDTRRKPG